MSVTNSFPRIIKIPTSQSSSSSSCCSSSAPNPCSSSSLRFSSTTAIVKPPSLARSCAAFHVAVRNSQTEGPIRRPVAPPSIPINKPTPPSQSPPTPPSPPSSASSAAAPVKPVIVDDKSAVTLEFQRLKAKELQEYFKQKKLEESNQGPAFGFVGKNEINNGRWAMFGFAVGMLTEYATGSDFVDQVKILLSNFGILDLE